MDRSAALRTLQLSGRPDTDEVNKAFRNREYELEQMIREAPEEGLRVRLKHELEQLREAHRSLSSPEPEHFGSSAGPDAPGRPTDFRPAPQPEFEAAARKREMADPEPAADGNTVSVALPPSRGAKFGGPGKWSRIGGRTVRILAGLVVLAGIFLYLTQAGPLEGWWRNFTRDQELYAQAIAARDSAADAEKAWEREARLLGVEDTDDVARARAALDRGEGLVSECRDEHALTAFLESRGLFDAGLEMLADLRADLDEQALTALDAVRALRGTLEETEREIDHEEREAGREVQRIDVLLQSARNREERERLEAELAKARSDLEFATEFQELCDALVFKDDTFAEIDGDLSRANALIGAKDPGGALEALLTARKGLEGILARKQELEDAVHGVRDAARLVEDARSRAEEDERHLFGAAEQVLSAVREKLSAGDLAGTVEALPEVRTRIGLVEELLAARRGVVELRERLDAADRFPEIRAKLQSAAEVFESGDTALRAGDQAAAGKAYAEARAVYEKGEELTKDALLAFAKGNRQVDGGKVSLAALDALLDLDPLNSRALNLRREIREASRTRMLVVPDQYPSIQAAMQAAAPGEIVHVRPGVYRGGLTFKEGVRLEGAGAERVTLRCGARENNVVYVKDCRSGLISGITLEHTGIGSGEKRYSGLHVERSSVRVVNCVVRNVAGNGITIEGPGSPTISGTVVRKSGWNGIYVAAGANASIGGCTVEENATSGITVAAAARTVILETNECRGNRHQGIFFGEGARGTARDNLCEKNGGNGIAVRGMGAAPTLEGNTCRSNTQFGLYFDRGAGGTADGNLCVENGYSGIAAVATDRTLLLRRNRCLGNERDGIYFFQGARGSAVGNVCEKNMDSGIALMGAARGVLLRENECRKNRSWGIYYGMGGGGTAEGNVCERNAKDGIAVVDEGTAPVLRGNVCRMNKDDGIHFGKATRGTAEGNRCENNQGFGVHAHGESSARFRDNECRNNGKGDFGGRAAPR